MSSGSVTAVHRATRRPGRLTVLAAVGAVCVAATSLGSERPAPTDAAGGPFMVKYNSYGGLIGYFSAYHDSTVGLAAGGVSWYSSMFPMIDQPLDNFQLGLGSSWLYPQLPATGTGHYCDSADSWVKTLPGQNDNLQLFFQTIEGGPGYWGGDHFFSKMAKYQIGETPACYEGGAAVSSPGWQFGNTTALTQDKTGLVQLSNKLLLPPDGLTFQSAPQGALLGSAYMNLPLLLRAPGLDPVATGGNNWTLFFNSANFKGPAAYFLPQFWSDLSKRDPNIVGKGLDAAGMLKHPAMAAEIGGIPNFEANSGSGASAQVYAKIPSLSFPVDANGRTVLAQDVKAYSATAMQTPYNSWLLGSPTVPTVSVSGTADLPLLPLDSSSVPVQQTQNGVASPIVGIDSQVTMGIFDAGKSYGFKWNQAAPNTTAQLPQYYQQTPAGRQVVSTVPAETGLQDVKFPNTPAKFINYAPPQPNWWNIDPAAPGGSVTLVDGSTVTYAWVRFVDQPALRRLNLTSTERATLQATVERMHQTWSTSTNYFPPPTSGNLVSFDPAMLVTPPAGMQAGYVPIVTSQSGFTHTPEYVPVVPERLLETRAENGQIGYSGAKPAAEQTVVLHVTGVGAANVPADAEAVVLNVTGAGATGDGFVTAWPCGTTRPNAANLNLTQSGTRPNLVISKIGANGNVCLYTQSGTDLVADINGWYPNGSAYVPVVPERLLETRAALGQAGYAGPKPVADQTVVLHVTGTGAANVPSTAAAVVLNVTGTEATADGFVTVWPCGTTRPLAANLNLTRDGTSPNLVISKVGAGGNVCLYTQSGTELIADLSGWYPADSQYVPVVPERLLETRDPNGLIGYFGPKPAAEATVTLQVTGVGVSNVASSASAVVLNVTGTNATGDGFVTVWPCDAPRPLAANLNVIKDGTRPNLVISKLSAQGTVCLYTQSGTDLIADVNGWFPA